MVKNQPAVWEMQVQTLVWEDSHGTLLQYSYWESLMGRGAWWAMTHGVTNSQTRMKLRSMHTSTCPLSPVDLDSLENCD